MTPEITRLHHVGHVVRDMPAALQLYRRLGFALPAPSYPAMVPQDGGALEPFGAANTHADFSQDFVELVTVVDVDGVGSRVPADARLVPLNAPPAVLPSLMERINATSANLSDCLDRYEGLHILMLSSSDIEATAARLTNSGIKHGGVNTVRRPVGPQVETVRYLEIDGVRPGVEAEGRIGVAADLDPGIQSSRAADHPNGAVGLVDATLCIADPELDAVRTRYEAYLDRTPKANGRGCVFDLGAATLTLVPASRLAEALPGQQPPALPTLVAYTVAVRDLAATKDLLQTNKVPLCRAASGELFVPATAAIGTVIAFR
ncbi:VOC family protein [Micromonospora sp. KC723]|uniref:VOC family protein n=1 Tax=Micromonospora sp. KC723 TaxID=2530381 RepID=UPI0010434FBF|nr:VOC family protein [Micromonospora sp. KC723]TDB73187.1 VOC family protein [Micromonospora sp. KC723]